MPLALGTASALVVAPVELIVKVADTALEPVTFTEGVMAQLGGYCVPVAGLLRTHKRLTNPVNPFTGVMETVPVLPVVAPGVAMVNGAPATVNGIVTVTGTVTVTGA
jgi:hypothetical protein